MVLPTDSIAGPVYPYDTQAIPKRSIASPVSSRSYVRPPSPKSSTTTAASLRALPGGALVLELLVVVVAGVGARDVVAVPIAGLEISFRSVGEGRVLLVGGLSYQKALPKTKPRPADG